MFGLIDSLEWSGLFFVGNVSAMVFFVWDSGFEFWLGFGFFRVVRDEVFVLVFAFVYSRLCF